jgi:RNA-directed DNA polymerase
MYEELMEQVVTEANATEAWRAVRRNSGSPGIDRMTTKELRGHIQTHWDSIRQKLLAGTYVPSPVKRVEIPKSNGGVRQLGIPTVTGPVDTANAFAGAATHIRSDVQ